MKNGCLCCNIRGDLVPAMKKILSNKDAIDAIIIETTGLADPAPVIQTFFTVDEIMNEIELDGVITVVDGKHIHQQLQTEKPEGAINEASQQIAFADRVVLNKLDLIDSDAVAKARDAIKAINGDVDIIETQFSKVDPKALIGINSFSLEKLLAKKPGFLDNGPKMAKHDKSVSSISFKFEGEILVAALNQVITSILRSENVNNLYRYKGVLAVKGMSKKFVFQGVHMLFNADFIGEWAEGEARESVFVFIGKNLNKAKLRAKFESCKAPDKLRFKVGDRIEARCRQDFLAGSVIKLWDEGNPYRLRLDGPDATEVWAPQDIDAYVRAAE